MKLKSAASIAIPASRDIEVKNTISPKVNTILQLIKAILISAIEEINPDKNPEKLHLIREIMTYHEAGHLLTRILNPHTPDIHEIFLSPFSEKVTQTLALPLACISPKKLSIYKFSKLGKNNTQKAVFKNCHKLNNEGIVARILDLLIGYCTENLLLHESGFLDLENTRGHASDITKIYAFIANTKREIPDITQFLSELYDLLKAFICTKTVKDFLQQTANTIAQKGTIKSKTDLRQHFKNKISDSEFEEIENLYKKLVQQSVHKLEENLAIRL